jgi:hypothetical protein
MATSQYLLPTYGVANDSSGSYQFLIPGYGVFNEAAPAVGGGRIMGSLAGLGGLAGHGGIAGPGGGMAG